MGWFWLQGLSWTRERRRGFASAFFPCLSGKVEYHIVVRIGGLLAKRRCFGLGRVGIPCGVVRRFLPGRPGAFTLMELMVATAVFMTLVVVLASISNEAASIWSRNESKSDVREAARAAIGRIATEMKQARLPVYQGDQTSLQFVVNPAHLSVPHGDSVFWQAPIATSGTAGDLAVVGYFLRRDADANTSRLCRLLVNPDDPDYTLHDGTGTWLTDDLLNRKAPGSEAGNLQGVFLENVLGMWVTAYQDATTPYPAGFDSRVEGRLPERVEISLAILGKQGADRATTLPDASTSANPAAFLNGLPDLLKPHVQTVTINVTFPR